MKTSHALVVIAVCSFVLLAQAQEQPQEHRFEGAGDKPGTVNQTINWEGVAFLKWQKNIGGITIKKIKVEQNCYLVFSEPNTMQMAFTQCASVELHRNVPRVH